MALINCNDCGTQMSDKAQSCPKCGAPNPNAAPVMHSSTVSFNPCARHPQAPAVAHCGNCGSAICKDCTDMSMYSIDNKPMCIDCNLTYMTTNISHLQSTKRWSMIKFIVLAVIIIVAWTVYRSNPGNTDTMIEAWLIAAVGGIFSTWSATKRTESEKVADELYAKLNPTGGLSDSVSGCVGRLLAALLLAPLWTAGYTIKHGFRWLSSTKELKKAQQEYDDYVAVLQQRGEI